MMRWLRRRIRDDRHTGMPHGHLNRISVQGKEYLRFTTHNFLLIFQGSLLFQVTIPPFARNVKPDSTPATNRIDVCNWHTYRKSGHLDGAFSFVFDIPQDFVYDKPCCYFYTTEVKSCPIRRLFLSLERSRSAAKGLG